MVSVLLGTKERKEVAKQGRKPEKNQVEAEAN
jgi:hypothetical protein